MIPPATTHTATIGSSQSSASFGLSLENEAHLMGILREGIYTDKVLAILREYSSNAWDAHRDAGKPELPITVTLPTRMDPTLYIRDHGLGLSHEAMFVVYTQYGKSTKRASDDVVGMLGIGSKSGFAYSDSFTVTSWHGGVKRIYVATLGDDEKGSLNLLAEEACEADETGVEIQIATRLEDHYDFQRTARRLFQHMKPRPTINVDLPDVPDEQTVLTNGTITLGDNGEWIAVMGCVPYRINLGALDATLLNKCLSKLGGLLQFGIGEVAISTSREELKYTTATKSKLIAKFDALVDEYVTQALTQLDTGKLSGWETRLRVKVLAQLELPLPEKWKLYGESFAKITYSHDDFTIIHNKAACTRLTVDSSTCLLVDDTGNDLVGYHFDHHDYVVRSTTKTPAELRTFLDAALVTSGLVGIAIELLSSRNWTAPPPPPQKKRSNPKHRARMFQLKIDHDGKAPWSDNWEAVTRVPTKDDVFVIIEGFKPEAMGHHLDFWKNYESDRKLAAAFGETLPVIYAYKTTEKRPTFEDKCEGTHYRAWREGWHKTLLTPERILLIDAYWRSHPNEEQRSYYDADLRPTPTQVTWLAEQLGDDHVFVEMYQAAAKAKKIVSKHTDENAIRQLALHNGLTFKASAMAVTVAALKKRYRLLARVGFRAMWNVGYSREEGEREERLDWIEYIQLRDQLVANVPNNVVQLVSVP